MNSVWYTIENMAGKQWSEFFGEFVNEGDEFDTYQEANQAQYEIERTGAKTNIVRHTKKLGGVEHTEVVG